MSIHGADKHGVENIGGYGDQCGAAAEGLNGEGKFAAVLGTNGFGSEVH